MSNRKAQPTQTIQKKTQTDLKNKQKHQFSSALYHILDCWMEMNATDSKILFSLQKCIWNVVQVQTELTLGTAMVTEVVGVVK